MMHVIINYNDLPENILDYAAQYNIVRQDFYIKVKLNESIFEEVKNCFVLIDDDAYTNYYLNYGIRTYVIHPGEELALYKKVFERKLTKENALIACIRIWTELKQTDFAYEQLMYEKLVIGTPYLHECPLCEYHHQKYGKFDYVHCPDRCPLSRLWPEGCENTSAPYYLAVDAYMNKDKALFTFYCDQIIKTSEEELCKMTSKKQ